MAGLRRALLILQDDAERAFVSDHLKAAGFETVAVASGDEGLVSLVRAVPNLIVCDIDSAAVPGIEIVEKVRKNPRWSAITAVVVCPADKRDLLRRALAAGASDFMFNPVDASALARIIDVHFKDKDKVAMTLPYDSKGQASSTLAATEKFGLAAPPNRGINLSGTSPAPSSSAAPSAKARHVTLLSGVVTNLLSLKLPEGSTSTEDLVSTCHVHLIEPIMRENGWVALCAGERVVAIFENSENQLPDHAARALRAAVGMIRAVAGFVDSLKQGSRAKSLPNIALSIGVHTGSMVLDDKLRTDTSAEPTGLAANIVQSLVEQTKEQAWSIIASRLTARAAGTGFTLGRRTSVLLPFLNSPMEVVEVLGLGGTGVAGLDESQEQVRQAFIANTRALGVIANRKKAGGIPAEIDAYRVLKRIGEGATAIAYLVEEKGRKEPIVLKILNEDIGGDEDKLQRFIQEFALITSVDHPNVARIYKQGFTENQAYIAMEYFSKGDLRNLTAGNKVEPELAVAMMFQVGGALAALHDVGIIHRDLKPTNIMVREDGSLAIADFGSAKARNSELTDTGTGIALGTPYYLSPEQCRGDPPEPASDIYSLGVMFFEMLTGVRPYTARSLAELMQKHMKAEPPTLPQHLSKYQPIVDRAMAKSLDKRYASAAEMLIDVMDLTQVPTFG